MYRTYDEEKRSELIYKTIQVMGELTSLVLRARSEEDLAENITPTSTHLRSGRIFFLNCEVPRIEDLRFKIDEVHELLESLETELRVVADRVQKRVQEQAEEDSRQSFGALNITGV
jgi:hypothetical protein